MNREKKEEALGNIPTVSESTGKNAHTGARPSDKLYHAVTTQVKRYH